MSEVMEELWAKAHDQPSDGSIGLYFITPEEILNRFLVQGVDPVKYELRSYPAMAGISQGWQEFIHGYNRYYY